MKTIVLYSLLFVSALAWGEDPRAARSVHLWYPAEDGVLFYNEMTVLESHTGSYFMACGWNHGYFGIQEIRDTEDKVVIFSVWDPGTQDDPDTVEDGLRVQVLHEGDGVDVSRFGNEGTGGKSMFPYQWNVGDTYRFAVRATIMGSRTAYSGFFYLNDEERWKHLVTFSTITGGEYLKGYYSFVEDFWRNGISAKQERKARYGNGWVVPEEGEPIPLLRSTFTADNTPTMNIDARLGDNRFVLMTGGKIENTLPLRESLLRSDTPTIPDDVLELLEN